jgi:cell division protein FtsI (penicillin-binding protein 3)
LAGKNGKETIELVKGREIPTGARFGEPSVDGTSVRLTLDEDIQAMAERVLVDRLKSAKATSGSVVVLDPKTGDILAMATAPSYDPGNTRNIELKDLRNPAIQDAFEPGSTAKVMTMAAVIEEGAATPKTKFTIPKRLKRADRYFKDHDDHGVLKLTLNGVLAKSSNMGSILAAEKIGDKKFVSYLKKFGIGESTGLNLPGESSGFIPDMKDPNQWSGTTFPTLAFGQGLSVSAVQVASVYATIANNGVRVAPRIIAGYTDADGEYTETEPSKKTRVISATTAKTVREMLESVVSKDGTAPQAQIPGYRVAGKTGTANKFSEETRGYSGYTASFIGMAPAEDPALVVAVSINTPGGEHYGSLVSGPVFRDVMSYALAKGKIAPSITKRPSMAVEW